MIRIKVCFLGTPTFAAVHLNTLLNSEQFEVVGVVTQPDRPAGRKMQLTPSAVKMLAEKFKLPVLTPENLRKEPNVNEQIRMWKADVAVVVAFGQILSQDFLDSFKLGAVNVHGSLLPRWRGAAPIQRSIEAGDAVTGVSLQKVVRKLDAGPVIGERQLVLNDEINATEVYDRLAVLGCELLQNELVKYARGELIPREQDESLVTHAAKIEKEESQLDFSQPALQLHNKVRAFSMGPGTFCMRDSKRLKIHKTKVMKVIESLSAGQIASVSDSELVLQTSQGGLALLEVQPESKPKMSITEYLKNLSPNMKPKKGDQFVTN